MSFASEASWEATDFVGDDSGARRHSTDRRRSERVIMPMRPTHVGADEVPSTSSLPTAPRRHRQGYFRGGEGADGRVLTAETLARDPHGVALHAKFSEGLAGALAEARGRAERFDKLDQRRVHRPSKYDPTRDADGGDDGRSAVASARRGHGPRGPVLAQLTSRAQRQRAGRSLGVGAGAFSAPMPTLVPQSLDDTELYSPSAALVPTTVSTMRAPAAAHGSTRFDDHTKSSRPSTPIRMRAASLVPDSSMASPEVRTALARLDAALLADAERRGGHGHDEPVAASAAASSFVYGDPRHFPGLYAARMDTGRDHVRLASDATGATVLPRFEAHNDTRRTHVARLGEALFDGGGGGGGATRGTGPSVLGHTDRDGFRMPPRRGRAMLDELVAPRVYPPRSEMTDMLLMERALMYKPDYRADTAERAMIAGAEFPEPINVRAAVMHEAAMELMDYNRDPHVRRIG